MKEVLNKYPLHILKKELINVRTGYRLEKQKLIEILRGLKSINKLTKDEVIELLIKSNYDTSKLPRKFYTLPNKLAKYNNLEFDEIQEIYRNYDKYRKFNEEVFKYLYKNDEDFKKYSDIGIDLGNKTNELKKYKDDIKFKTEKNKLDDFLNSLIIQSGKNFKEAFLISKEYLPNMYDSYSYFPTDILTEVIKKPYKLIEEYPDLLDFLNGLKSYKGRNPESKIEILKNLCSKYENITSDNLVEYKNKFLEDFKIIEELDEYKEYKKKMDEISNERKELQKKIYKKRVEYRFRKETNDRISILDSTLNFTHSIFIMFLEQNICKNFGVLFSRVFRVSDYY